MGIHCSVLHFGIAKLVYLPKQFVKISRTDGGYKPTNRSLFVWLVVSAILKNISQWEGLSHILWKIKHV